MDIQREMRWAGLTAVEKVSERQVVLQHFGESEVWEFPAAAVVVVVVLIVVVVVVVVNWLVTWYATILYQGEASRYHFPSSTVGAEPTFIHVHNS